MRDVDSFTKELIGWLRVGGTVEEYYKNYSELTDVLIIDDIRSFERTPAAAGYCKELVKRFVKEKKKILLTTDSKTAIYRWPGGLFARKIQIKKPDKKLKVDILRKYAATRNFYVPEDILLLVSEIDGTFVLGPGGPIIREAFNIHNGRLSLRDTEDLKTLHEIHIAVNNCVDHTHVTIFLTGLCFCPLKTHHHIVDIFRAALGDGIKRFVQGVLLGRISVYREAGISLIHLRIGIIELITSFPDKL